jgi:hypothetical protein
VTLAAASRRIRYGEKASLSGRLAGPDGAPLGARPVAIQMLSRSNRWTTLQTITSDSSGAFQTRVRLAYNRTLRALFPGEPGAGSAGSGQVAVGVRAQVTAALVQPATTRPAPGVRVSVRGAVAPRKRSLLLLAERRSRGTYRRVVRRAVAARRGRVTTGFRFARTGHYRFRLASLPDGRNLGARSEALDVQVAQP